MSNPTEHTPSNQGETVVASSSAEGLQDDEDIISVQESTNSNEEDRPSQLENEAIAKQRPSLVALAISDTNENAQDIDVSEFVVELELEENAGEDSAVGPADDDNEDEDADAELPLNAGQLDPEINKEILPPSVLPQDQTKANTVDYAPVQNGGSGNHDVAGIGAAVSALTSIFKFRHQDPMIIRQKAIDRFQVQKKALDDLVISANNHSKALQQSSTGQIAKGFIEQGIEPPVDAMKNAFSIDDKAQSHWRSLDQVMGQVESQINQLQRTAEAAEFEPGQVKEDLANSVDQLTKSTQENLGGLTDEHGNSLSEMIDKCGQRMHEMLERVLTALRQLLGRQETALQP